MSKIFLFFLIILVFSGCSILNIDTIERFSSYNFYYGMLHNHSNYSDGKDNPSVAYYYARNIAHLDFFSLSDHAINLSSNEWMRLKLIADSYNRDYEYTTFYGFEWTHAYYGHVTIINTSDICRAKEFETDTFTKLTDWLECHEGIAFFNHPGRKDNGMEFNHFESSPSDKFVGMELWNNNSGDYNVYYYNDGYFSHDEKMGYYEEAITRGWRIGASGSDDNHEGTWGMRNDYRHCVLAHALTRTEIYNALKARKMFATSDKNLKLYFEADGQVMGSVINPGHYNILIKATDDDNEIFTQVQLLKNGIVIQTWNPNTESPSITYNISSVNDDSFYVRVKQQDADEAISSPVFIFESHPFHM